MHTREVRGEVCRPAGVRWVAEGGGVCQELESALDITADVANADKPSQRVTRDDSDLPSKFEGYRQLFISD